MASVRVFIDGFNVYHSLEPLHLARYKWLDYYRLVMKFKQHDWSIDTVLYFTSLADWNPEKRSRHLQFISVLEDTGVQVRYGKFKRKDCVCKKHFPGFKIDLRYHTHVEKQTDVNIALAMVDGAYQGAYDVAVLVTGDNDLVPAVHLIKQRFPQKEVHLVVPLGRKAKALESVSDQVHRISEELLRQCQLPDPYVFKNPKRKSVAKPETWI